MDASHFPIPCDPLIAAFVATLDEDGREYFEERAAVAEFEGNLPRAEAEAQAHRLTVAYLQRREKPAG